MKKLNLVLLALFLSIVFLYGPETSIASEDSKPRTILSVSDDEIQSMTKEQSQKIYDWLYSERDRIIAESSPEAQKIYAEYAIYKEKDKQRREIEYSYLEKYMPGKVKLDNFGNKGYMLTSAEKKQMEDYLTQYHPEWVQLKEFRKQFLKTKGKQLRAININAIPKLRKSNNEYQRFEQLKKIIHQKLSELYKDK
ncbi:hypothetical protein KAU11_11775 [Candidatus Babeliales bacterium]|nr:hypothetical protein [Candidatus Babeliales bacterium]